MDTTRTDIAHLYRRAGFGGRKPEIDAAVSAGYRETVDALVQGLHENRDSASEQIASPDFSGNRDVDGINLQLWWLNRMIVTPTPLREKLTLFWHGHFTSGLRKVGYVRLLYLQNEMFRQWGGGSFRDLAQAVARDGAMMSWLDVSTSVKGRPNENFPRELLELFTLGIGNYVQSDVGAASRAFTGSWYSPLTWTWRESPGQHDSGIKTFLGESGNLDGADIIDIAIRRPESARFVLSKLWSHFAYPVTPTDPIIMDLIPSYEPTLDVSAALHSIFLHPAFLSDAARTGLVKQPIEYLVGAARSLQIDASLAPLDPHRPPGQGAATNPGLARLAGALGQAPFDPPNVAGWGQNEYWFSTATTLARMEAAQAMVSVGDLSTVEAAAAKDRTAATAQLLGVERWGQTTIAALAGVVNNSKVLVSMAMNAPEFLLN